MSKHSRYFNLAIALVLAVTLFGAHQPAKAQSKGASNHTKGDNSTAPFVPGEVVVGFVSGKQLPAYSVQAAGVAEALGATVERVSADGTALLQVAPDADVRALASQLTGRPGVKFAEPNYIFSLLPLPQNKPVRQDVVLRRSAKGDEFAYQGKPLHAIPVPNLVGAPNNPPADKNSSSKITSTYPNDPYLWNNNGWAWVGADIVWPNKTASAGVCEVDSGVDYSHPDLSGKIIKGFDIVNNDTDPMDDLGHGTAVAGILAANLNNKIGMAGVSTVKVVAMKVFNAQGSATSYDIAIAIIMCANRSDIKVINMSLGGPADSSFFYIAVDYAVNSKNKLVVVAAGNSFDDSIQYPAYYSGYSEFQNKVLSVAAAGEIVDVYDVDDNFLYSYVDNNCKAQFSTYGDWVSVVAPGTDIYTTMPWDKPFYMNYYDGYATRYDYFSGTSAATPFVAATAARRWGLQPNEANYQIGWDISNISSSSSGYGVDTSNPSCWPSEMSGRAYVNVAAALQRFGLEVGAYDAVTGLPLIGAQIQSYQGSTLRGTATVNPVTYKNPSDVDPARVYTGYTAYTNILNLPAGGGYQTKINKTGYTNGSQPAYQHLPWGTYNGYYGYAGIAAVPPKSSKFELAMGWLSWYRSDFPADYTHSIIGSGDLDMNVQIPTLPNYLDTSQPQDFIVGLEGTDIGYYGGDPRGEDGIFPYALLQREGGATDWLPVETIVIDSRTKHGTLATNSAMPYYPGEYDVAATDYGQTIDQDGDGCGNNYGASYDPNYDNTCGGSGTPGIPLLGTYLSPFIYVWKDGAIKAFSDMKAYNGGSPYNPGDPCNADYWFGLNISTFVLTGPVIYTAPNSGQLCSSANGLSANLPALGSRFNPKK
jgi:subtilisin family serine protease